MARWQPEPCPVPGGIIVIMDDTVDMVEAMANINAFYAHESCGQCTLLSREGSLVGCEKITTEDVCMGSAREEDADLIACGCQSD